MQGALIDNSEKEAGMSVAHVQRPDRQSWWVCRADQPVAGSAHERHFPDSDARAFIPSCCPYRTDFLRGEPRLRGGPPHRGAHRGGERGPAGTARRRGAPVSNRRAWNELSARLPTCEITNEATRIAGTVPPTETGALYLEYSRNGSRSSYEAVCNSRRDRLATFASAEALEHQGQFTVALQRGVEAILEGNRRAGSRMRRGCPLQRRRACA